MGYMHNFLRMKISYFKNRRIATNIKEYITEAEQEFGEDVSQVVKSQTSRWLFTVGKFS